MDTSTLRHVVGRAVAASASRLPDAVVRRALVAASHAGRGLPVGPPDARRALVVAPHPDDESLAVGGLSHRLSDAGAELSLVLVTAGEASRAGGDPASLGRARTAEARAAAAVLGIGRVDELGLPDGALGDHVPALAERLDTALRQWRPDVVLTTWFGDDHPDHRAVNAALALLAPDHGDLPVWGGEMWTPAPATNLVDLRPIDVEAKARAVAQHRTAARAFDLTARLALDRYRSVNALAGRGHAEAYVVAPLGDLPRLQARLGTT